MIRSEEQQRHVQLSVIVPLYNEEENVPLFHTGLNKVLREQHLSYEVVYVDDGSADETFLRLEYLAMTDQHVRVVRLRRNFGQTAAMAAGVAHSTGDVLIFMDGDLQNDPIDIPRLLAKLDGGYDVVSGWRRHRKDAHVSRKLPSMIANRLIAKVTGVYLHDYGCTLKAYRREVFQHLRLYGEMHRFLPAYASLVGARITELEVEHHARQFGVSKYGISRTFRVLLDLVTFKFLGKFAAKPLHAFGVPALGALSLGTGSAAILLVQTLLNSGLFAKQRVEAGQKLQRRRQEGQGFLLLLSVLFSGLGIQFIMLGLLAELLTRTYHESQGKTPYVVRTVLPAQEGVAEVDSLTSSYISQLLID